MASATAWKGSQGGLASIPWAAQARRASGVEVMVQPRVVVHRPAGLAVLEAGDQQVDEELVRQAALRQQPEQAGVDRPDQAAGELRRSSGPMSKLGLVEPNSAGRTALLLTLERS